MKTFHDNWQSRQVQIKNGPLAGNLGHVTATSEPRVEVVLVVDGLEGVVERPQTEIVPSTQIVPGLEQFPGVLRLHEGLVLIHDLERFLSLDEARALDEAMDTAMDAAMDETSGT